jgi:FdhD protein
VGFRYGGLPYAVMMATPEDLEDFALGFTLTEGIAGEAGDIRHIRVGPAEGGVEIDIALTPPRFQAFLARERARSLAGHTSCGICGVRDLGALPGCGASLVPGPPPAADAVRRALAGLRARQPLAARTHATHAAAWADASGDLSDVREDVGRHNALDKLIGAMLRAGRDPRAGFGVVTSRCSFEMVQKAAAARFAALVAISAPTALAVRKAGEAGLTLIAGAGRM